MRSVLAAVSVATLLVAGCGDERQRRGGVIIARDAGPSSIDTGVVVRDAGFVPGRDAGFRDAGSFPGRDAGFRDAGRPPGRDAGFRDAGFRDAGSTTSPDSGVSLTTISDIQRGFVVEGAGVTIQNAIVTAVYFSGCWVQDPSGGPYSGIRVFANQAPGVVVGDLVNVSGTVLEYFGDTEIDQATITYLGPGPSLSPTSVTLAQAATEDYEGVFVRITNAPSIQTTWDCSVDDPGCNDTGLWQIGGPTGVLVYDFTYQDADWPSNVGITPVTGVMTYRWNRRRILPRISADFGP